MNSDENHVKETLVASENFSRLTPVHEATLALNTLLAEKYRVVGFVGEGASAKVYRVEQVFFQQEFAFKLFDKRRSDGTAIARFQREARVSSQLVHPNLIRAVDFGVLNGEQPYLVMDLVHGLTLQDLLKQVGCLSLEEAIVVFTSICEGLSYAHSMGLVHRDIKPGNIMLDGHTDAILGTPKILDFGIARTLEAEAMDLTKTGEIFGMHHLQLI
jgi:serine/threonine protein kinase